MLLTFSVSGSDAYPIGDLGGDFTLAEAIEAESHHAASEADSDHLEDPSEESREAFRQRVVSAATAALRAPGDSYRDPIGVTWSLVERAPEVRS